MDKIKVRNFVCLSPEAKKGYWGSAHYFDGYLPVLKKTDGCYMIRPYLLNHWYLRSHLILYNSRDIYKEVLELMRAKESKNEV